MSKSMTIDEMIELMLSQVTKPDFPMTKDEMLEYYYRLGFHAGYRLSESINNGELKADES